MTSGASKKPLSEPLFVEPLATLLHGLHLRGLAVGVDDAVRVAAVFRYAVGWSRERRVQALKALIARSDEERLLVEQLAPHLFVMSEHDLKAVKALEREEADEEKSQEHDTGNGWPESEPASAEQVARAEEKSLPQQTALKEEAEPTPSEQATVFNEGGRLEELARSEGPRTYRLEVSEPTTPFDRSLVREAAFHLSAPSVPTRASWLEGRRTVEATVVRGGRLSLRYATRLTRSPVIFLEDVSSSMACWPDYGQQLGKALKRQGNVVVRCFMCGTPDDLYSDSQMSRRLEWSQIVESLSDPTILILSNAEALDKMISRRTDWLGAFRKAVWLHPQPAELWGLGARWLADQARVVPLSDEGLLRLTTPRLDNGELPPRWQPSRPCAGESSSARLLAIRAAIGVEAFWWLCAGAVFDSLHVLSARLWWKLAEEVIEVPLACVQRVWALPDVNVLADGTVRLRGDLGRALLENLERERPELLTDVVRWGTDIIVRDLERLPADSLAAVSACAYKGCLRILDDKQRDRGRLDLEALTNEGIGKWIPESIHERLLLSEAHEEPDREPKLADGNTPDSAQGLKEETLRTTFGLADSWKERRKVFENISEQLEDPEACLAFVDRLRRIVRDGNDLFFLYGVAEEAVHRWPAYARQARDLEDRFFDHIPPPEDLELFRSVNTPRDGRVKLWCEIPAGKGWIGSPKSEAGRFDQEGPRHRVTIVRPFRLAAVPVTNAQYAAFDPARADAERPDHPVGITWYEAVSFCRWLAARVPGCVDARLAMEEEWEYACRAGTETRYWSGDSEEALAEVGWYGKNSGRRLRRVGDKRANPWGLYDMHGNMWEWTARTWKADYSGREVGITVDPAVQPTDLAAAASRGVVCVIRGGGFTDSSDWARAAYRLGWHSDGGIWFQGFRVALPAFPERP